MKHHLLRKVSCEPVHDATPASVLLRDLTQTIRVKGEYSCEYCARVFKSSQLKYQHKLKCKCQWLQLGDDTTESMVDKVARLEKEVARLKELPPQNVVTNNTQNIQNNINITINKNDFCRENKTYLEKDLLFECFKDMDLIKLLEEIHFNPEHPENHNVRIKNVKQNLMEFIENGKWIAKKKDEVLDHLVMNGWRVLHTYYKDNKDDIQDEMENEEIDDSLGWLRKIYNEDKEMLKQLKNDAFLLVMNNKALLLQKA
jgi:carboxypeptidase C (cathepsin A)